MTQNEETIENLMYRNKDLDHRVNQLIKDKISLRNEIDSMTSSQPWAPSDDQKEEAIELLMLRNSDLEARLEASLSENKKLRSNIKLVDNREHIDYMHTLEDENDLLSKLLHEYKKGIKSFCKSFDNIVKS